MLPGLGGADEPLVHSSLPWTPRLSSSPPSLLLKSPTDAYSQGKILNGKPAVLGHYNAEKWRRPLMARLSSSITALADPGLTPPSKAKAPTSWYLGTCRRIPERCSCEALVCFHFPFQLC